MGTSYRIAGIGLSGLGAMVAVVVVAFSGWQLSSALTSESSSPKAQAAKAYGKLPLSFQANRGQTDSRVKFVSRGAGYTLFLTPQESVLSLRKPARTNVSGAEGAQGDRARSASAPESVATVRMRLEGANPDPRIAGLERLEGETNYLTGRDPKNWRTGVPSFASALYRDVYRGVDLVYHGKQGQLEYDFRVAPNADPGRIALRFSGARDVSLDRQGDLLLDTPAGAVRQQAPVIYQQIGGRRRGVSGRFVLRAGNRVGFRVGAYDRSKTLVIDPTLVYSSYLGGGGNDIGKSVAVDSSGSAYVTGLTASVDFPSKNALQTANSGGQDVFVSKLTPDGTALAYSTFLGGSGDEQGNGIAVDASGAAYVTGNTSSTNFPLKNALQATCTGADGCGDAFVAKLKPDGSGLDYSTYLGGDQFEIGNAIAVDSAGAANVTGLTGSSGSGTSTTSFPLSNAAQPTYGGGDNSEAFVTKLAPNDGTSAVTLAYSTFLGGSSSPFAEEPHGIALDSSGAAYVIGTTDAADFPTTAGAYDATCGTDSPSTCNGGAYDAFVTKYSPTGAVAYSTFVGGSDFEQGFAIAVGRGGSDAGTAYVLGVTSSTDYPTTAGAYDLTCGTTPPPSGTACIDDAFVTKLNAAGSNLVYSTYIGGQSFEGKNQGVPGIAVNSAGNAFVDGKTQSTDFPIVRPVADAGSGAYVTEFNSAGSDLVFSTLFGGSASGEPSGMALDSAGNAYITGGTGARDFPTLNPIQAKLATAADAFVAKFSPASDVNLAAPYVTGVSPRGGDVSGGRQVKITGTGFGGASAVGFGGVPAATFTVDSSTQITAVGPAHAPGRAAVTVTTGQGTSPPNPISGFVYGEGMFATTPAPPFAFSPSGGPPTVTLLKTGKVLVAGAGTTSAVLYDPKAGTFAPTGSLNVSRRFNTATLLPSGKVLIVGGGENPAVGELYDPTAGTFSPTKGAPLFSPSSGTATLLKSGKVLITGAVNQAQLYDPAADTFSATIGPPIDNHSGGLATLLPSGKVLVVGGSSGNTRSAELFDPSSEAFTRTGALNTGRIRFTLTPLPGGKVLATGGQAAGFGLLRSAELYDSQTGDWIVTGSLDDTRRSHAATLLPSGKVLITGGSSSAFGTASVVPSAELFDPAARGGQGGFTSAGRMENPIAEPAAALLSSDPGGFAADPAVCGDNCGKVLVAGLGRIVTASSFSSASVAELYTPPAPVDPNPNPNPNPDPNPAPNPNPIPIPNTIPIVKDVVAPLVTLGGKLAQSIKQGFVSVSVRSDEAVRLSATGSVSRPALRATSRASAAARAEKAKTYRLRSTKVAAKARQRVVLRLRLTKKSIKAVKQGLKRGRRSTVRVTIVAADAAGNKRSVKRQIRIKD